VHVRAIWQQRYKEEWKIQNIKAKITLIGDDIFAVGTS
jgi:hypothetical protein